MNKTQLTQYITFGTNGTFFEINHLPETNKTCIQHFWANGEENGDEIEIDFDLTKKLAEALADIIANAN